jgi:hypothetical protein
MREAERNLTTASAEIGIANADLFPRFGLTTLLGRDSPALSSLSGGTADIWALAAFFRSCLRLCVSASKKLPPIQLQEVRHRSDAQVVILNLVLLIGRM